LILRGSQRVGNSFSEIKRLKTAHRRALATRHRPGIRTSYLHIQICPFFAILIVPVFAFSRVEILRNTMKMVPKWFSPLLTYHRRTAHRQNMEGTRQNRPSILKKAKLINLKFCSKDGAFGEILVSDWIRSQLTDGAVFNSRAFDWPA